MHRCDCIPSVDCWDNLIHSNLISLKSDVSFTYCFVGWNDGFPVSYLIAFRQHIHCVSKRVPPNFGNHFVKSWPIFKIHSLMKGNWIFDISRITYLLQLVWKKSTTATLFTILILHNLAYIVQIRCKWKRYYSASCWYLNFGHNPHNKLTSTRLEKIHNCYVSTILVLHNWIFHILCSKRLPLAHTQAGRRRRHSSIALLITPCSIPCQIPFYFIYCPFDELFELLCFQGNAISCFRKFETSATYFCFEFNSLSSST
jgi:hypothetical protein